jgi:hypothetical protein
MLKMCVLGVGDFLWVEVREVAVAGGRSAKNWQRRCGWGEVVVEKRISPLRFASVEMTIHGGRVEKE